MNRSSIVLVSDRPKLIQQLHNALDSVFDLVVMGAHPPSVLSVVGALAPAAVVVDRAVYGLGVEDTLRLLQQEEPGQKVLLIDDEPEGLESDELSELIDGRRISRQSIVPDLLIELRRAVGHSSASWRVH